MMKKISPLKLMLMAEGITQRAFAAMIGVHESIISGICCGWRIPDEELQKRIAENLGCCVEDLFPQEGGRAR